MHTKQTTGALVNADDVTTSPVDDLEKTINELETRVTSLERLLMRVVDKLELDYPGIIV